MTTHIIDATPPPDFPSQVVIEQPKEFSRRHPQAAYWLRVKTESGKVDAVQLGGAVGPAHARRLARELGFEPTHWTEPGYGVPHLF
jgi:hypothetical protein